MCTEKYINPFTDFGFKLLFGTPANKEFLIGFLNAILDAPQEIVDISYNNPEVFGKRPDDRRAVYDLYCTTADGSHIIVEMQNAYQRYFQDRTIYYSSFLMQAASKKGEWDYRLPPIYTVAILNFNMDRYLGSPEFKHVVKLADVKTGEVFFDNLTYIYLEMPKFNKDVDDLHGYADSWMYIIKNMVLLDEKPAKFRERIFTRFFQAAEIARFTPEERAAYETSLKVMRDYNNTVRSAAEKGLAEGRAEGRAEGLAEGLEKGLAEGRAEGLAEGLEKGQKAKALEIARRLKGLGMPAAEIAQTTALPISEIEKL